MTASMSSPTMFFDRFFRPSMMNSCCQICFVLQKLGHLAVVQPIAFPEAAPKKKTQNKKKRKNKGPAMGQWPLLWQQMTPLQELLPKLVLVLRRHQPRYPGFDLWPIAFQRWFHTKLQRRLYSKRKHFVDMEQGCLGTSPIFQDLRTKRLERLLEMCHTFGPGCSLHTPATICYWVTGPTSGPTTSHPVSKTLLPSVLWFFNGKLSS